MKAKVTVKQSNPGWAKRLVKEYSKEEIVAVGFPKGSKSSSLRYDDSDKSVLDIAVINNFGTEDERIPARPFMKLSAPKIIKDTNKTKKTLLPTLNRGAVSKKDILEAVGAQAAGIIAEEIRDLKSPPNALVTIEKKGSANPLIDTGKLRQSVSYVVRTRSKT